MRGGMRAMAVARIAVGIIFLFFGQYKFFGPDFAYGGFQKYLSAYIGGEAVGFYKIILAKLVLPHATFFAYFVGLGELLIGVSLLIGLWVRPASILGMVHMTSLTLATWHAAAGQPLWRYFGYQLDHIPLFFLFAIFFAARAGEKWGLDSRTHAARHRAAAA